MHGVVFIIYRDTVFSFLMFKLQRISDEAEVKCNGGMKTLSLYDQLRSY